MVLCIGESVGTFTPSWIIKSELCCCGGNIHIRGKSKSSLGWGVCRNHGSTFSDCNLSMQFLHESFHLNTWMLKQVGLTIPDNELVALSCRFFSWATTTSTWISKALKVYRGKNWQPFRIEWKSRLCFQPWTKLFKLVLEEIRISRANVEPRRLFSPSATPIATTTWI